MKRIVSHRIRMARLSQGLSMDDLVEKMDASISKMSISKIERGLFNPSQQVVRSIAKVCKVPESYFYANDCSFTEFYYRKKNGLPLRKLKQIEAQLVTKVEDCIEQEYSLRITKTVFDNPIKNVIVTSYNDVEVATKNLRKYWEIGTQPIHSVYELLEEKGFIIIETPIDAEGFDGTSTIVNNKIPVIIINSKLNVTNERKRFTALHELAHLTLNFKIDGNEKEKYLEHPYGTVTVKIPDEERLCEHFACAMLVQKESLFRRIGDKRKDLLLKELISIRNLYGISIAALIHRTHDLAIISDSTYNHWYNDIIKKNRMEEGWGSYPIEEVADRQELLSEIFKTEYK